MKRITLRDLVAWWQYRRLCRFLQFSLPGMAADYEPLPLRQWRNSAIYCRYTWTSLLSWTK